MEKGLFRLDTRCLVFCALFTALIIIGGFISIPIGVVPVALADFFVMVSSALQNPLCSLLSVLMYIALGLLGLPVFANGKAGIAVIIGPTAGFLAGYVVMALIMSFALYRDGGVKRKAWAYMLIALIANAVLFSLGAAWLSHNLSLGFISTLLVAVVPFLPGAIIKIVLSYFIYKRVNIWQY